MAFINAPILSKAAIKAIISLVLLSAPTMAANCNLKVPKNPLSAKGLATPYVLSGAGCTMADAGTEGFVEATILDPHTGKLYAYSPLVITHGTKPLIKPVVPKLPKDAVVGLWFGSNNDAQTLIDDHGSLKQGRCVNGIPGSIFGQFASCNGKEFFAAAKKAIHHGKLHIPKIGKAKGGHACPTTRAFEVVDQDQSDNVVTQYLLQNGRTAQLTKKNKKKKKNATPISNGSDNALVDDFLNPALGCKPFSAIALDDIGTKRPTLATDELLAMHQKSPVALVPESDPMVMTNGATTFNLKKVNAYRTAVGQRKAHSLKDAGAKKYCEHLFKIAPAVIKSQKRFTIKQASPSLAVGDTLFTFLGARYVASYGVLKCQDLLHRTSPIAVVPATGQATMVKFGQSQHV